MVFSNAVQNVGTSKEQQNDQVSTQRLIEFLGGEYNKGNEIFSANEVMWQVGLIYRTCTEEELCQ